MTELSQSHRSGLNRRPLDSGSGVIGVIPRSHNDLHGSASQIKPAAGGKNPPATVPELSYGDFFADSEPGPWGRIARVIQVVAFALAAFGVWGLARRWEFIVGVFQ